MNIYRLIFKILTDLLLAFILPGEAFRKGYL